MNIGILKESGGERRVAILPSGVKELRGIQVDVLVESNAGRGAFTEDEAYRESGAKVEEKKEVIGNSTVLVKINPPSSPEINEMREGTVLVSLLEPLKNSSLMADLAKRKITCFSLDSIPRTSRAQTMDVLSSMSTIAGYKAVLLAATHLPTFFPMFMTAAGTVIPARVLVLGAGVAGLQAIATARRLGAVVEAFDVRSTVMEDVESLGAKYIGVEGAQEDPGAGGYAIEQNEEFLRKQRKLIHDHAIKSDVIIATAQIPGKEAPKLVSRETVASMKPGSVIVDLAASYGGNCELCKRDSTIVEYGITIIGDSNLPSTMPVDASKMLTKNIVNFLKLMIKEGRLHLNFEDELLRGSCITHNQEFVNPGVKGIFTRMTPTSS